MKFRKNIYIVSMSAALITLSSCGITPQDEGLGAANNKAMSGVVVDGYLAGAIVYADVNENNKMDAWENRALTDIDGYFSYNAKNSVNYCELPATDPKSFHCLRAPAGYDMVMVRMTKGYDLATVEPFTGTISMRMNLTALDVTTPMAATPITGLLAEIPADQLAQFLVTESLAVDTTGAGDISTTDFLDFTNTLSDDQRRVMLMLALQTHKVADVVANFLDPLYGSANNGASGFFGVNGDVPNDGSSYVYMAIASEAIRTGTDLSTILSNTASVQLVIGVAIDNINKNIIEEYNARLPQDADTGVLDNPMDAMTPIALTDVPVGTDAIVATVGSTIATVFTAALSDLGDTSLSVRDDITSRLRAIDAVVSMTRAGEIAATAEAVTLASDAAYLLNLRSPKVNMVSMKLKLVNGDTGAGIADYNSRQSFNELFAVSSPFSATDTNGTVNDQGFGGNTMDLSKGADESVSVNFVGTTDAEGNVDPAADSGTMTIDANLLGGDFATDDGSPLVLDGTWEKVDDYTMIMNVEVTEGVYEPVIVKPNDDGSGYYFDLGGEQVVWE